MKKDTLELNVGVKSCFSTIVIGKAKTFNDLLKKRIWTS